MRSQFKWVLVEKNIHNPDSEDVYDAEILHNSYHALITKLEKIKPGVRVSNIVFYNFASDANGDPKVISLNAETYSKLRPDFLLYVFYTRESGVGTELQILESLHQRILRLEKMKISP